MRAEVAFFTIVVRCVFGAAVAAMVDPLIFALLTFVALLVVIVKSLRTLVAFVVVIELIPSAGIALAIVEVASAFWTFMTAFLIEIGNKLRTAVAYLFGIPIVLANWTFLANRPMQVRRLFRALAAEATLVEDGLLFGAHVAARFLLPFVLVVVRSLLGAYAFLRFFVPKLSIRAVRAKSEAIDRVGLSAFALFGSMAPDEILRAYAFFELFVPRARFGTRLALPLLVAVGIFGITLALLNLRIEDLCGFWTLVVAGQTLFSGGEPVFGQWAELAKAVFFGENSGLLGAETLAVPEELQGVGTGALLGNFDQRRAAVAQVRAFLLDPVLWANALAQLSVPAGPGFADAGDPAPFPELAAALLALEVHPQLGRRAVHAVLPVP